MLPLQTHQSLHDAYLEQVKHKSDRLMNYFLVSFFIVGLLLALFYDTWLVGIGVGIGILASLAIGRVIATQLWGVSAYDPWTLTAVPIVLLLTGLLACWVPASRAAHVDPLVALRYE